MNTFDFFLPSSVLLFLSFHSLTSFFFFLTFSPDFFSFLSLLIFSHFFSFSPDFFLISDCDSTQQMQMSGFQRFKKLIWLLISRWICYHCVPFPRSEVCPCPWYHLVQVPIPHLNEKSASLEKNPSKIRFLAKIPNFSFPSKNSRFFRKVSDFSPKLISFLLPSIRIQITINQKGMKKKNF